MKESTENTKAVAPDDDEKENDEEFLNSAEAFSFRNIMQGYNKRVPLTRPSREEE